MTIELKNESPVNGTTQEGGNCHKKKKKKQKQNLIQSLRLVPSQLIDAN
jgi:hypothetical protein